MTDRVGIIGRRPRLEVSPAGWLRSLSADHHRAWLPRGAPVCEVGRRDRWERLQVAAVDDDEVTLVSASAELTLRPAADGAVAWSISLTDGGPARYVRFPFLMAVAQVAPAHPVHDHEGRPLFGRRPASGTVPSWPLPLALIHADEAALAVLLEVAEGTEQYDAWRLMDAGVRLTAQRSTLSGTWVVLDGGWPTVFERFRRHVRREHDLTDYDRPDLAWQREQLVQHVAFMFGGELYDHDSCEFDMDRLLDAGARDFGGYDSVLLWCAYPRIGIDERTQWEFYDDVPGGRAAIRRLVETAHRRGVRIFVPYKPWDRAAEVVGQAVAPDDIELARLVGDIDADGVFLDTMSAVDPRFRAALDAVRPGIALMSEGRVRGAALESITASWDQASSLDVAQGDWSARQETLPDADLGRFIVPEHHLFAVNRHAGGTNRIRTIQRGFFNATGWIVWQDIFGLMLLYSPAEAGFLHRCHRILRQHADAFVRSHAVTPYVTTSHAQVYAHRFVSDQKRVWTLFNSARSRVTGPLLPVAPRAGHHFVDLWTGCDVGVDAAGRAYHELDAEAVGAIAEFPRILGWDPATRCLSSSRRTDADVTVELRSEVGASIVLPWDGHLDVGRTVPIGGSRVAACLLRDGEVLDQVELTT